MYAWVNNGWTKFKSKQLTLSQSNLWLINFICTCFHQWMIKSLSPMNNPSTTWSTNMQAWKKNQRLVEPPNVRIPMCPSIQMAKTRPQGNGPGITHINDYLVWLRSSHGKVLCWTDHRIYKLHEPQPSALNPTPWQAVLMANLVWNNSH